MEWTYKNVIIRVETDGKFYFSINGEVHTEDSLDCAKHKIDDLLEYYYSFSKIVLFVYEYILVILKIVVSYVVYFAKIPLTKINLKIKRKLNSFKMKKKSKKEKKPTEEKAKNRQIILYGLKK